MELIGSVGCAIADALMDNEEGTLEQQTFSDVVIAVENVLMEEGHTDIARKFLMIILATRPDPTYGDVIKQMPTVPRYFEREDAPKDWHCYAREGDTIYRHSKGFDEWIGAHQIHQQMLLVSPGTLEGRTDWDKI